MATKSAFLTGSASGIGKALCQQLASQGWQLTLVDVDSSALMQQQSSLQQSAGVDVLVMAADVCDNQAMARAFKEHVARFQSLDLVVLNAGIGERGDFLDPAATTETLEMTLDVDLTAVISGMRLAAQSMIALGKGGHIISLASAAGIFPVPAGPYYAAAKAGVVHVTRSLAPRLAPYGIQVAAICPQYVDTPLVQTMLKDQPEVAKAMMGPLFGQPLLTPTQVVDVILQKAQRPLPQKGRKVSFREAYAGAGCVFLILQHGSVVDPFAVNQAHEATAATAAGSQSASKVAKPKQQQQQPQPPTSHLAAASAASMARFSNQQALTAFAQQPLPSHYAKLQVVQLSHKFRQAVEMVTVKMPAEIPAGHVLVRRLFVGINASDVNYTSGRYHGSSSAASAALPYDAGFESVGVVVGAAADAAASCPVGSPVATMDAGFSEYGLAPARRVLPIPCPAPEVVALLTSGLTASLALAEVGGLQLPGFSNVSSSNSLGSKHRIVLVTAAAGGTGQFAVQLARMAGCHVVATCGGQDKAQLLKELGVDRVINYRHEDVKGVLKREYPQGVNLIYESVGGEMFELCVDALAPQGKLIIIGMMSAYGENWPLSTNKGLPEKLLWKSASVCGFFLLRYANLWGSHLERLCQLVTAGQLAVALDAIPFKGLAAVPAGVDRLQGGNSRGKVVVQLSQEVPTAQQGAAKL